MNVKFYWIVILFGFVQLEIFIKVGKQGFRKVDLEKKEKSLSLSLKEEKNTVKNKKIDAKIFSTHENKKKHSNR